jgi:hypothetical protein
MSTLRTKLGDTLMTALVGFEIECRWCLIKSESVQLFLISCVSPGPDPPPPQFHALALPEFGALPR